MVRVKPGSQPHAHGCAPDRARRAGQIPLGPRRRGLQPGFDPVKRAQSGLESRSGGCTPSLGHRRGVRRVGRSRGALPAWRQHVIDEAMGQSVSTGLRWITNDGVLVRHIRTESPSFAPGVHRAVPTASRRDGGSKARRRHRAQGSGPVTGPNLGPSRRPVAPGVWPTAGACVAPVAPGRVAGGPRGAFRGASGSRTRGAPRGGRSLTPPLDHDALDHDATDHERWRVDAEYPHQHAIVHRGVSRLTPAAGQIPVAAAAQRVRSTNDPVTEQKPPRTPEPAHAPGF
jgi:hypothetical protein